VAVFQKSTADIETASELGFAALRSKDSLIPGLESADTPLNQLDDISW
jgi:hypothetical protein